MSFRTCLFVARLEDERCRRLLEARAARLPRFYEPVPWGDRPELSITYVPHTRALIGAVRFDRDRRTEDASLLTWGGPHPRSLKTASALAHASDSELRGIEGIVAAIAVTPGEITIVTGAAGVTELYAARSAEASVWATHAAAAGLLAFEAPAVEPTAIPELMTLDYVGGDLTMIEGVRAVPTATRISLTRDGETARSYWPASKRWEPLPESEAHEHGERHLLGSLQRRLAGTTEVSCGLTAGLDSRVAAVALRQLGIGFDAFTVAEEGHPDARGAREVASVLGIPHRRRDVGWLDEDAAYGFFDLTARWCDGMRGVALGAEDWPIAIEALVSGSGAETGRGFYYPPDAAARPRPRPRAVRTFITNRVRARFGGARPEVGDMLAARVDKWLAEAESLGHGGWSSLDVVYGEQRWRRWYRSQVAPVHTLLIPAFSTPEIQRALAALPLRDRTSNGFNRGFLGRHEPRLAPLASERPTSRGLALLRARSAGAALARPVRGALGSRGRRAEAGWPAARHWDQLPGVRRRLTDEVLASPLLSELMGDRWVSRTREGFLRDEAVATEATLASAAPVLLQRALSDACTASSPTTAG